MIYYFATFFLNILVEAFIWAVSNYTALFLPFLNYWGISDTNFLSIFGVLTFFGIMGYYFKLVFEPSQLSQIVKWITIFLFVTVTINYLFIEGYKVYGVYNPLMNAFYSLIIPLIFMYILYNQLDSKVPITKNPYFWINLRFIIPNLIGLFLFFAGDKIYKTDFILFVKISIAKNGFFIIGHVFACIAFYYARYTKYLHQKTTTPLPPQ